MKPKNMLKKVLAMIVMLFLLSIFFLIKNIQKTNIMNKTELINKLLHLGSTIEICNSTQTSKKAKELAHNLLDEYLEANLKI